MNVKVTTGGDLHVGLWGAWFQLTVSEARELATLLLEQAAQAEEKALDLAQQAAQVQTALRAIDEGFEKLREVMDGAGIL